jgi:hypothetical protein
MNKAEFIALLTPIFWIWLGVIVCVVIPLWLFFVWRKVKKSR